MWGIEELGHASDDCAPFLCLLLLAARNGFKLLESEKKLTLPDRTSLTFTEILSCSVP